MASEQQGRHVVDRYKIEIAKRWSLEDLYVFSRTYEQVYFLAYSLAPNAPGLDFDRTSFAYHAFPWRGGYSAVNFYNQLRYSVPIQRRPSIISIEYSSPGFIELGVVLLVATSVAKLVKSVAGSLKEMNSTYNEVVTDLRKRELLRLEVKKKELELSQAQLRVIEENADTMARLLGFEGHKDLTERTGHPFITLKILLSYYRRLRKLAEYSVRGKVDL